VDVPGRRYVEFDDFRYRMYSNTVRRITSAELLK
jgi:hypothetical protein